jgi:hypothetical protein
MKTKKHIQAEEVPQRIERFCRSHVVLYGVLFCLLFALTKMDGVLLRTMKTSYAHDFGLIDEYAPEKSRLASHQLSGSEIRLTTISGA